jgi:hypothetical protein
MPLALAAAAVIAAIPVHSSSSIAVADLNGDKHADIAASTSSGAIRVRLGDGTGRFRSPGGATLKPAGGSRELVAADVDRDGRLDLATANAKTGLTVLRGDGRGHFKAFAGGHVKTGWFVFTLVAGRFDRGPTTDLVVTGEHDRMATLRGDGHGGFRVVKDSCPDCLYAATADFNKDGFSDLAPSYSHGEPTGAEALLGGSTTGLLRSVGPVGRTSAYPDGIAVADFNGDAKVDVAVMQEAQSSVKILTGDGRGRLLGGSPTVKVGRSDEVVSGDFDGDGHADLAAGKGVFLGDGKLGFTPAAKTVGDVAADVNADGRADLISVTDLKLATGKGEFAPSVKW